MLMFMPYVIIGFCSFKIKSQLFWISYIFVKSNYYNRKKVDKNSYIVCKVIIMHPFFMSNESVTKYSINSDSEPETMLSIGCADEKFSDSC
jgi:hypothetical protein